MKTINDLVDELNAAFEYGDFYVDKDDDMETYTIFVRVPGDTYRVIEMSKYNKRWMAQPSFGLVSIDIQKEIMDFIYTTDSNHWFDELEKKYYIAVGMYDRTSKIIYFKNDNAHDFKLRTMIDFNEGDLQEYDIFTESEIEDLKSTLSKKWRRL